MSKRRAVAKYTAAGALSAVYVLGAVRAMRPDPEDKKVTTQQVATVGGLLLGLTWTAILL